MGHPRYKLNYAFNHGNQIYTGPGSSEVLKDIDKLKTCGTVDNTFHEILKVFLLTNDKKLTQEVKDKLRAITYSVYGDNVLEPLVEACIEAIDINIVCVENLDEWDTEQWCLKSELEPEEEPLF